MNRVIVVGASSVSLSVAALSIGLTPPPARIQEQRMPVAPVRADLNTTPPPQAPELSPTAVALLRELEHLTATLAPRLWPDWRAGSEPFLLRTPTWEYLRRHPRPPSDFQPFYSAALAESLWVRRTSDSLRVQAAFPIGESMTAVISVPDSGDDPCLWVLKAAHEIFHTYQGTRRIENPFVGPYRGFNDLTFPFPYTDSTLNAALRLEAESIFLLVTDSAARGIQQRLLPLTWRIEARVLPDSLVGRYKALTEWTEGVARYTERELARSASNDQMYQPTASFERAFPHASYAVTWREHYGNQLAPIRFVGEGVQGRVMFYYLGMGKAYVLDALAPGWRDRYLTTPLDFLLVSARH